MAAVTSPAPAGFVRIQVSLNWAGPGHYERRELPCKHCGHPTHLRDDLGEPADKVCVEADIEAKAMAYAQSLLPVPATRPGRTKAGAA